jgi:hypothetical protein
MTEQPAKPPEPAPTEEHVEGHDVFVTRDESGITSLSEDEGGADPGVAANEGVDEATEEVVDEDVGEGDNSGPDSD